jgi:CDP-diacylglycerol---serine O-phosphatidyltransferase
MDETASPKRRRGIYLLPNLFTTAALFAGFYAITAAINHRFEYAAVAIFIAMILDGMDGRVARLTNTQSAFGAEYDSLADLTSFGIAPAIVLYVWSLSSLGNFQGLPSPSAAAILAGFLWFGLDQDFSGEGVRHLALALSMLTGLLMVSNFRYYSFKDVDLRGRIPFVKVILMMLAFAVLFTNPPLMLFALFTSYAISGPVITLLMRKRRRERRT